MQTQQQQLVPQFYCSPFSPSVVGEIETYQGLCTPALTPLPNPLNPLPSPVTPTPLPVNPIANPLYPFASPVGPLPILPPKGF
jgi:hypothetical protein